MNCCWNHNATTMLPIILSLYGYNFFFSSSSSIGHQTENPPLQNHNSLSNLTAHHNKIGLEFARSNNRPFLVQWIFDHTHTHLGIFSHFWLENKWLKILFIYVCIPVHSVRSIMSHWYLLWLHIIEVQNESNGSNCRK